MVQAVYVNCTLECVKEDIKASIPMPYLPQFFKLDVSRNKYRTCAIITRGLYIYYPIFEVHFFVFKEVFSGKSVLMYG